MRPAVRYPARVVGLARGLLGALLLLAQPVWASCPPDCPATRQCNCCGICPPMATPTTAATASVTAAAATATAVPTATVTATATPTATMTSLPASTATPTPTPTATPSATPTTNATPTAPLLGMMFFRVGAGTSAFYHHFAGATEQDVQMQFKTAAKASQWFVQSDANQSSANDINFTWRKNGAGTTLTTFISQGTSQGSDTNSAHAQTYTSLTDYASLIESSGGVSGPSTIASVAQITKTDDTAHPGVIHWSATHESSIDGNYCTRQYNDTCHVGTIANGWPMPFASSWSNLTLVLDTPLTSQPVTYTLHNVTQSLDVMAVTMPADNATRVQSVDCSSNCAYNASDIHVVRVTCTDCGQSRGETFTIEYATGGQVVASRAGRWTSGLRYASEGTEWVTGKAQGLHRVGAATARNFVANMSATAAVDVTLQLCGGAGTTDPLDPDCSGTRLGCTITAGQTDCRCAPGDPTGQCLDASVTEWDFSAGDTWVVESTATGTTGGTLAYAMEFIP